MGVRAGLTCAAVLLAAGVAGCGDDGGGDDAEASRDDANPPMHARVEITPKGYKPKHTRILVGGTVTFVNVDEEESHTAETEDLPNRVSDSNEFDTHTLTWEEPYTITFHKPEEVTYHDSLSDFTGTVEAVPKARPVP